MKTGKRSDKRWTPKEDQQLLELFDADASWPLIAITLERGVEDVQERAGKLRHEIEPGQSEETLMSWSMKKDRQLVELAGTNLIEIAYKMDTSQIIKVAWMSGEAGRSRSNQHIVRPKELLSSAPSLMRERSFQCPVAVDRSSNSTLRMERRGDQL